MQCWKYGSQRIVSIFNIVLTAVLRHFNKYGLRPMNASCQNSCRIYVRLLPTSPKCVSSIVIRIASGVSSTQKVEGAILVANINGDKDSIEVMSGAVLLQLIYTTCGATTFVVYGNFWCMKYGEMATWGKPKFCGPWPP